MKGKLNKVDNGYVLLVDNIMYATDNDKLSKENCDEIFGVIDVEKLANDVGEKYNHSLYQFAKDRFIEGYNKAIELNKDKVFTEEQVIEFTMSMISQYVQGNTNIWNRELLSESLQQPNEIEVEIMMESSKFIVDKSQRDDVRNGFNYRPKRDSENCLILQKI
jgi:methanogenic corrinoid protein MtbC1